MLGWPAGGTPQQINLPLPRLPKQSRTPRRHAELLNPDPEASGLTDEGGGGQQEAGGRWDPQRRWIRQTAGTERQLF